MPRLPALAVRQLDIGNALMQAEQIQGARTRNMLAERAIRREDERDRLSGDVANALGTAWNPQATPATGNALTLPGEALPAAGATAPGAPGPRGRTPIPSSLLRLYSVDPQSAAGWLTLVNSADERRIGEAKRLTDEGARLAISVLDAPDHDKPAAYAQAVAAARQRGIPVDNLPPQWGPDASRALQIAVLEATSLDELVKPTAPTTRQLKTGDKIITQEFADRRWVTVAVAPRSETGGVSAAQQANNAEIVTARQRIRALDVQPGETPRQALRRLSTKVSDTGRESPDYDPLIARDFRSAMQHQVGGDDEFDTFNRWLDQPVPLPDEPIEAAPQPAQPGFVSRAADWIGRQLGDDVGQTAAGATTFPGEELAPPVPVVTGGQLRTVPPAPAALVGPTSRYEGTNPPPPTDSSATRGAARSPAPSVTVDGISGTFTGEYSNGQPVYRTADGRRFVLEP